MEPDVRGYQGAAWQPGAIGFGTQGHLIGVARPSD